MSQPMPKRVKIPTDPYPMDKMCNFCARFMLWAVVFAFPLMMDSSKYTAITKYKGTCFTWLFVITVVMLLFCIIISSATRVSKSKKLTREQLLQPPFIADVAIIAYWVLMFISCLTAQDVNTAFFGLTPRNNGFFFQTMYVASYFIISRALMLKKNDALIFAWGGAALGFCCLLHFFGIDLYDIASVNGPSYAGPFWTTTKYRFLGPVGNVNLGSYILSAAAVISAGLYICKRAPKSDKYCLTTLLCFVLSFYAELNINTDAGVVALAVAGLLIPPVLCRSMERLERIAQVYTVAFALILFNTWLVEHKLRGEEFGSMGKLLVLATILGALFTAAVMLVNRKKLFELKKKTLTIVCISAVALVLAAGIVLSVVITAPDPIAVGSAAGAVRPLEALDMTEKSDTIVHELGQILRGNFDDSFGHNRLFTWKRTLRLVKLHPVFGIGPDNFKTFFASYFLDEAIKMFPSSNGGLDKAHNEFLDVLLDNGIVGLLAYLAFFGCLLWYAFRRVDEDRLAPVLGVAVAAYMAHAFFGYQLPLQSPVMWMMIGLLGAYVRSEGADAPADVQAVTK